MARTLKIFKTEITIGKRLIGTGRDDETFGIGSTFGWDNRSIRKLKAYRGVVYACVNRIAESYASYEPVITRTTGKEVKRVDTHPLLQLLQHPNGMGQKAVPVGLFDLLFATAAYIELQGDVYWYLAMGENTRQPKEIVILRADKVGKDLDDNGEILNYYVRSKGRKVVLEINEILPFIGFDPEDPYRGIGTIEAASDYIKTEEYSTRFTKNFFLNNAGISGILTLSGDVVKGAFKKLVRAWRDKYEGPENAGKVMIVRGSEASFEKIGLGLNELDMSALRKMSREDIAMMFGVPIELLGLVTEGSGLGRANIEVLEYIFSKYTIEPKLKRLDNILQFALERYWPDTSLTVGHANIIPEDKEFELNKTDKLVDRVYTRNELRRKEGLEDIDGGDQLFIPIQNIPINEVSLANEPVKSIKIKVNRKVAATESEDLAVEEKPLESVHKENFRLSIMRNQKAYERRYRKKFNPILKEQMKEALDNLEAHSSSIKAFDKLFDDSIADGKMVEKLLPLLTTLGATQGALGLKFAGDNESEFRMTAAYETILREGTRRMATRFNDETIDQLNKTLAEGIQEGESLGKLKSRVEDVYRGAEGYRSLRVARTETLKASNNATNEAYKQTGYVTGKQWYANPGADEECMSFDGKIINLDESYIKQGESFSYFDANGDEQTEVNSYEDVDSPPLHPNCRCTIVPVR
jgi:HK97 family phage portal protein